MSKHHLSNFIPKVTYLHPKTPPCTLLLPHHKKVRISPPPGTSVELLLSENRWPHPPELSSYVWLFLIFVSHPVFKGWLFFELTAQHVSGIFQTFMRAEHKETSAGRPDNTFPITAELTFDSLGASWFAKKPQKRPTQKSHHRVVLSRRLLWTIHEFE